MYLLLLLLLLPLTSCYEIVDRGEETSISWSTNVHVLAVAIPALLAITAAWLWRRPAQRAVGLVLSVLALGGAFAAFVVFTSKITITKDEIYDWHGFPWDRVKRGFAFGDVARLSFHIEHKRSGRQTSAAQIWDLQLRNGAFEHLDPGDLWDRAQEDILERLRQRGVRIGVDPAILGRPSDDPFVVTVATGELHLDSGSAKERLSALVFGGFLWRLRKADGDAELGGEAAARRPVRGDWKHSVADGPRVLHLSLRLGDDGRYRYAVAKQAQVLETEGTFRISDLEIVFDSAGSLLTCLLPKR